MDEYKNSKEWQALNEIWKSLSKEQREGNYDAFKTLSEYVKFNYVVKKAEDERVDHQDNYKYLNNVSAKAKQLVIDLVDKGEKNLYHSMMAIIDAKKNEITSVEQLWNYYSKRFGGARSYIYTYENEIKEIMQLCLDKYNKK